MGGGCSLHDSNSAASLSNILGDSFKEAVHKISSNEDLRGDFIRFTHSKGWVKNYGACQQPFHLISSDKVQYLLPGGEVLVIEKGKCEINYQEGSISSNNSLRSFTTQSITRMAIKMLKRQTKLIKFICRCKQSGPLVLMCAYRLFSTTPQYHHNMISLSVAKLIRKTSQSTLAFTSRTVSTFSTSSREVSAGLSRFHRATSHFRQYLHQASRKIDMHDLDDETDLDHPLSPAVRNINNNCMNNRSNFPLLMSTVSSSTAATTATTSTTFIFANGSNDVTLVEEFTLLDENENKQDHTEISFLSRPTNNRRTLDSVPSTNSLDADPKTLPRTTCANSTNLGSFINLLGRVADGAIDDAYVRSNTTSVDNWIQQIAVFLEQVPIGITISKRHPKSHIFSYVYVNKYFEKMTKYCRRELLGQMFCCLHMEEYTELSQVNDMQKATSTGNPCRIAITNVRKDGTPFLNFIYLHPIFDKEQQCSYYIGLQYDLTGHEHQYRNDLVAMEDLMGLLVVLFW
jgi:PAS domain S-box-containing protein